MIVAGPYFQERMRDFFSGKVSLRPYRLYAVSLAVLVFLAWPSNPVSYYIQFASKPITFPITFILTFVFAFVLCLIPEFSAQRGENSLTDWVFYTSVGVLSTYLSYLLFSIVHVSLVFLLAAPVLVVAAAASGLNISAVAAACFVAFTFCLSAKTVTNMINLLLEKRPFFRTLFFGAYMLFALLLSVRLYPSYNPALAAQSIIIDADRNGYLEDLFASAWQTTVLLYAIVIGVSSLVSVLRLFLLRREAKARI